MEIKTLFPLVGVIVGWLLSEASSVIRIRREERRIINRTITTLIEIRNEFRDVHFLLKGGKELYGRDLTEPERQCLIESHLNPLNFEDYTKVIEDLSGISPILAVRLRGMFESQKDLLELKLDAIQPFHDLYQYMLTTFDSTYVLCSKRIRNLILLLSLKQGLLSFMRLAWYFMCESDAKESWGSVARSLSKQYTIKNRKHNKANSADAKSRAAD